MVIFIPNHKFKVQLKIAINEMLQMIKQQSHNTQK